VLKKNYHTKKKHAASRKMQEIAWGFLPIDAGWEMPKLRRYPLGISFCWLSVMKNMGNEARSQ
jgi:hypothetical protein